MAGRRASVSWFCSRNIAALHSYCLNRPVGTCIDRTVRSIYITGRTDRSIGPNRSVNKSCSKGDKALSQHGNISCYDGDNPMNAKVQARIVPQTAPTGEDSAKRRQIVQGARSIFLAQGFDAASMNDIARSAGVSKGTLYVYFDNKEQLFQAIVQEECLFHAETTFNLDPGNHDVE